MSDVSNPRLKGILEALLFVCKKPLTPQELVPIVETDEAIIEKALQELLVEYESKGLQIARVAGGWQMVTRVENSEYVDKLLKSPIITTLSPAALETLAIIAYKQPVTRLEIENIRGVASDGVIKTLIDKRIVKEIGRGDGVGRPILLGTSIEFLRHFGLQDLGDLPELPEGTLEQAKAFHDGRVLPPEIADKQLELNAVQPAPENQIIIEGETVSHGN